MNLTTFACVGVGVIFVTTSSSFEKLSKTKKGLRLVGAATCGFISGQVLTQFFDMGTNIAKILNQNEEIQKSLRFYFYRLSNMQFIPQSMVEHYDKLKRLDEL